MNDPQVPSQFFDGTPQVADPLEDTGVASAPPDAISEMPEAAISEVAGWHPVTLPSLGQYYEGRLPKGVVHITPWTTQQEETMARYGGNPQAMMAGLMRDNVRFAGGMTYEDLLITDQFFLIMQLRSISLSRFMHVNTECGFCGKMDEVQINLNEMGVRTPEPDEVEPIEITLPRCGKTVALRFMRVKDALAEVAYQEQTEAKTVTRYRYARQILSIDGQSAKFDEKQDFVGSLVLLDLTVLRNALEDKETGVQSTVSRTCSQCGKVEKGWVAPLGAGFFRAGDADIRAEVEVASRAGRGN